MTCYTLTLALTVLILICISYVHLYTRAMAKIIKLFALSLLHISVTISSLDFRFDLEIDLRVVESCHCNFCS